MKPLRRLAAAAFLLGSALPATAADFTSTWNNTTGNWTDTSKWSTPGAPGTFPNNGVSTYNAIQTDGTLTVNQAITIENYTLGGGGVGAKNTGAGFDFTVNGLLTYNGTGYAGTYFNGTGIINANGGALFIGGPKQLDGRVLNLSGNSTWSTDSFYLSNSASLVNTASGVLTNTVGGFNVLDGSGTFTNAGTFTRGSGGGYTAIRVLSTNTGTMNVTSGTLSFEGTITNAGALVAGAGTVISFDGNGTTHNLNAGTSVSGAGTVRFGGLNNSTSFNAGTYNVTGTTVISVAGGNSTNFNSAASTGSLSLSSGFLNVSSTLSLGDGTTARNSTWSGGGFALTNGGTLTNTVGSTLTVNITNNSSDLEANGTGTKTFNNAGTFTMSGTAPALTRIHPVFNNTGTVNATNSNGPLNFNGGVTQHSGSTITGGTWNVTSGSTLNINTGSNITTIGSGASVTLDGAGSSFAKVTTALNNNQGSFTLKNNRDLTTAGAYANSGTTRVEDSTTVMTIGSGGSAAYTQTIGETVLVGGAMIDASVFNLNGGELKGSGTIASSLVTGGTNVIAPGQSPGTLTINGSLTLSSGSTLDMEIGGLTQGTLYDYLDVNGTLTLAGLLNLSFLNDFQNSLGMGSLFTLATSDAAVLGGFSNVANGGFLTDMASLHTFSVHYGVGSLYNPNDVVLYAVTPEPGRALLLMLGLLGLTQRRKRHACTVDSAAL